MRIALIHYRLGWKGGLETRLHNYLAYWRAQGHQLSLIGAKVASEWEIPSGVELIKASPGLTPKPLRRLVFARKVARILQRQDFDFSLSLGRTLGQDAVLAAANHRGYLRAMGRRPWSLSDWSQDQLDARAFSATPLIFAASQMMKQELVELYDISPEKIHILPPPIDSSRFFPALREQRATFRQQLGMPEDRLCFAFVSTSHYRKGLDILLKAFAGLDPKRFALFVAGSPVSTALPHVHSLGFLKNPAALYAAADGYLHPARYEPFGQIVTEALQCGTPVLVSDRVGAKEIIRPQEGQVVESLEPEAWREAIEAFPAQPFNISAEVAREKGLLLEQHMQKMMEWA